MSSNMLANNVSVSVVIPVYNAEKYLRRSVDSVLAQTLSSIQIILVDDGSTDSCPQICDEYKEKNKDTITVLHKKNGGLTAAWKDGCRLATGDYIGFCDDDDYIEPEMFETMYTRATSGDYDIVCCGVKHVFEDDPDKVWFDSVKFEEDEIDRKTLEEKYYPILINDGSFMGRTMLAGRYSRLTRRELIQKNIELCNDEVFQAEDMQPSICLYSDAQKIAIIKNYYPYVYCTNNSSMTMAYTTKYMDSLKVAKDNLIRISNTKKVYDFSQQIINDYLCLAVLELKGCIYKRKTLGYSDIKKDINAICSIPDVVEAIEHNTLNRLSIAERLFIYFMKRHMYLAIYVCVRMYFR